eukprot:g14784.t1
MFSGFDFKRFSLDALQDEENEDVTPSTPAPLPVVPEDAERSESTEPPPPQKPPRADEEASEWDWDQDTAAPVKTTGVAVVGSPGQRNEETHSQGMYLEGTTTTTTTTTSVAIPTSVGSSIGAATPPKPGQIDGQGASGAGKLGDMGQEGRVADERRDTRVFQEADEAPGGVRVTEEVFSNKTANQAPEKAATGAAENGVALATEGRAEMVTINGDHAANTSDTNDAGESPAPPYCYGEGQTHRDSESVQVAIAETGVAAEETTSDAKALASMRRELDRVRGAASGLESALRESRSEALELRELLAAEKNTTREQAGHISSLSNEVSATRTGFQESNAAHQRTAERSQAFEEELHNTRQLVDGLRAESATLQAQVNEATEDRQALEGQLRHLQAGLTEGQEAARQEGRHEMEMLEARLKELLKDRDRKQAELDLQNARRKETREMARDLESQLAAVERIAQEREVELNNLKDEMSALRRNTGEATDQKNTWATKYEALERNFKQVRAQSKRAETELEEVRQNAARIEAEKAVLEERVEVEGAERVTVVASVSHERDFLLRQVDRLEHELAELRRSQEEQATAAAARAHTTGVLEEYRTRAQQALKRANEITSHTASENKRLEAEINKLSAEVAQQRPLWEQSKEMVEVHHAEIAKLKQQLASKANELDSAAAARAALERRLEEEEEEMRNANTSVMRLEAQGKSLKQELHRHQKALAMAQENGATLQTRLADKEAALQAAESLQRKKPPQEGADVEKCPSSPTPAVRPVSMTWEEELASRSGTPRSGMVADAAGVACTDRRRSLGESISSMPSEGDSADVAQGSVGEQLFYVHQLRERMSKEQIEMRSLISELEASRTAADAQAAKQAQLEKQLEAALLDKKRLQDLDSGRNAAINLTYLKNCVVGCLRTSEPSEHARLLPVITTILKLSEDEASLIARNISTRAQHQGSFGGSLPKAGVGGDAGEGGGKSASRSWWGTNLQKK